MGGTDIQPGTKDIVIPAFTDKRITVKGDADLIPGNIKQGVNLFGVTGTLEPLEGHPIAQIVTAQVEIGSTKKSLEISLPEGFVPDVFLALNESDIFLGDNVYGMSGARTDFNDKNSELIGMADYAKSSSSRLQSCDIRNNILTLQISTGFNSFNLRHGTWNVQMVKFTE